MASRAVRMLPDAVAPVSCAADTTANRCRRRTTTTREAEKVRERLGRVQEQLRRVRANVRVLREQVDHLRDVADDAETRKLVSQTPLADRDWQDARTDYVRHATLLEEAEHEVEELLAERDRLLDRLLELEGTT